MFKGHVPFAPNADPERGKREVQNAILMEEPDCSDIPYPYQLIVKQCLIKKIDERITSTRDILKILDGDNESDYWNGLSIKAEKTVKDYIDYLKMFPRGKFREDAYNGILSMSQTQHKKAKPAPAQQHLMNLILTAVASALISYLIFQLTH